MQSTVLPAHSRIAAGPRLATVINGLLLQLRRDLRHISWYPEVSIHALRRRTKKLQGLMHLVRDCVDKPARRQIGKLLRQIHHAFAAHRDQHVMQALALKMGDHGWPPHLDCGQPNPSATTLKELEAVAVELSALFASLPVAQLTWEQVRERHRRTLRKARQGWCDALKKCTPVSLHDCRKQTKALYYQLLFMRLFNGGGEKRIRRVEKLGQRLGRHHDLWLYRETLRCQGRLTSPLRRTIAKREADARAKALRLCKKLTER